VPDTYPAPRTKLRSSLDLLSIMANTGDKFSHSPDLGFREIKKTIKK